MVRRRLSREPYQEYRSRLQQRWRPHILARDRGRCRVCGAREDLEMAHLTDCVAFARAAAARLTPLVPCQTFARYATDGGLVFGDLEAPPNQAKLLADPDPLALPPDPDRKSTRLNSSHGYISY